VSELAERLRERHWVKIIESLDDGHWHSYEICNQDGQEWPCFTERMIRETEQES
jgi:hypothetical protein